MSVLPASQNQRRTLYRNAMYGLLGALLVTSLASRFLGFEMHLVVAVIVTFIGALSFLQFNTLDEMAKQAHYIAWYWGGLIGLTAMAGFTIAMAITPAAFAFVETLMLRWAGDTEPQTAFLLGLIVTPSLMMLGFAGWWSVYWLRRR